MPGDASILRLRGAEIGMFWVWIVVVVLVIVAVSVFVGLQLRGSRQHKVSREEMLALKSSGAFQHRKSNTP